MITLPNGYDRKRGLLKFRCPKDRNELVKHCTENNHVWFHANDNTARMVKINGAARTWKRDANRIEIPYKYGMYEYGIWTLGDINRVLIPI